MNAAPAIALLLGLLVGCSLGQQTATIPYPYTGSDDDGGGDGGAGGSGSFGSGPASASVSSSASAGSGAGSGSSAIATTVSTGAGAGGGGELCSPEDGEGPCVACAKLSCCIEVQACAQDDGCACWVGCIEETSGAINLCFVQCGVPGGAIVDLLDCSAAACEAECGDLAL